MNTCPRCGEKQIQDGGRYVQIDTAKFNTKIKVFFFWLPISLSFTVKYCAACGFLAVQDITPGA